MKALVAIEPNNTQYLEVEKPKAEKDMVVVKVSKAGICATDYAIHTGDCSFVRDGSIKYPVRFGHEWSGVVESVGEDVKNLKPGDHVVSDAGITCGLCEACQRGDYANCPAIKSVGTVNTWNGCFAEYMAVPERHLFHLPEAISLEDAALIEPTAIAYDAFTNVDMSKVSTVAVMGTGAIGMASAWLAKYYGAKTVIMVGRNDKKLNTAKEVGVDIVINNKDKDAVEAIKELTNCKGVDLTIEASGSDKLLIDSFHITKSHGRVSLLSFYEKNIDNLPMDNIVLRCLTVRGAAGSFGSPAKVIEIMKDNPMKLTPIISHRIPFETCLDAFENEKDYHDEKIKIIIDFEEGK